MPDYYECFQCKRKYQNAVYCPRCGVLTVEKFLAVGQHLEIKSKPQPAPKIIKVYQENKSPAIDKLATEITEEIRARRFWRSFGFLFTLGLIAFACYIAYTLTMAFIHGLTGV